jgi:hypothetical protein
MKIRYLIVLMVLILGVYGGWQLQGKFNSDVSQADTSSHLFTWKEGVSQRYRVQMNSSMNLNNTDAGAIANQTMYVKLNAELNLHTLQADQNSALVGIQLSGVQLNVSGKSDPEINQLLQKPFRVEFSSGGVPGDFEFPEGLTTQEQTILKNIVRTFTVSFSEKETNWTRSEEHASGYYEAAYERVSSTKIHKNKSNFVSSPSSPMLVNAAISSAEFIELDRNKNWISYMQVHEVIETTEKGGPAILIENRANIELNDNANVNLAKNLWQFTAADPIQSPVHLQRPSLKLSAEEARLQLLAQVPKLDETLQNRTKQIHILRDLLRVDGSIPATLLEQMETQLLSDRTRADLYLALELAATVESQAALTSVMTDPKWSMRDVIRATVALAGIKNPSPETLAVLWEAAYGDRPQLSATATYTLGSMGSRMKANNNPEYHSLRDDLLSSAYGSNSAQQKATFIYALGNTRDSDIAVDVSTFLNDEQPAVRRAAALSLGLMPTETSSEVLVSRFQQESSSAVRGAIAESLSVLPVVDTEAAMGSVAKAIQIESDEKARHSMASFMGKNLVKHPEYKPMLQKLIRKEPSKRVRQVIAEALATQL